VTTVDHKRIGHPLHLLCAADDRIAGCEALILRIQLMFPHNTFVSPQVFNRMFTMHGTTMIFFVVVPVLIGFANYLVPLMIGARDMAFPRLNAFSFWLTALGGLLLYFSFLGGSGLYGAGNAPDVGWWAYAPLTLKAFSPGHSSDYWTIALIVAGFGSIGSAVNFIATVFCMRCPGMRLDRMPLLVWMNLVMSALLILAISPLTAAQLMLLVDRYLGGHFFDTQAGGSAVIWMHFFWIFGHPEVYVLVLPAFAFVSEIIPVFSRKPIFGYSVMVAATIAIAFVSMSVWAHHMFTIGMSSYANSFFAITTMAVGIPTGIKIFNWLATMWGGRIQLRTPMLFAIAFLFQFLIAGLTGIIQAAAPVDWQLSLSYFVVAHFHYVIVGGILCALFAAFYYWYPKVTGRMMSETLGRWHFWLVRARLSPVFRPDAHPGTPGHAATHLHLRARPRLGHLELPHHARCLLTGGGHPRLRCQPRSVPVPRRAGGQRSVGRVDSRVVGELSASRIQLRHDPSRRQPSAALGPQAPRGLRRPVRMTTMSSR
jgi:cytochrome c oxidase subunit 1